MEMQKGMYDTNKWLVEIIDIIGVNRNEKKWHL